MMVKNSTTNALSSIVAVWAIFIQVADANACEANPVCTVKDPTGTPLNIRMGPNATIIGHAPNGTRLEFIDHVESDGKTWARVANFDPGTQGVEVAEGYVFASYLECETPLPENAVFNDYPRCKVADPTGTPLNMRTKPGGEIMASIRNGTVLTIWETRTVGGKTWAGAYRDPEDNAVGWVFDDYLNCEEDKY